MIENEKYVDIWWFFDNFSDEFQKSILKIIHDYCDKYEYDAWSISSEIETWIEEQRTIATR